MSAFEYVNSLSHKKNNMMKDTDNDELAESLYQPYLTNKAFSQYIDTIEEILNVVMEYASKSNHNVADTRLVIS